MPGFVNSIKFLLINRKYLFNSFPTFLDNIAVVLFKKKSNKGPLFAVWDITDKCNCRCAYCDHWKNPHSHKELETKEKLEIINKLAAAKVGGLSICGGEPLLVDELDVIIRHAKSLGLFVNLDTNGSILFEEAEKLVKSGLDSIIVSVETGNSDQNDTIRAHKNLFEKIDRGICKLNGIRNGPKPAIFIRTLIHKKSYKKLDDFVQYWKNKVDKIIFQPIHDSPNNYLKIPSGFTIEGHEEQEFRKIYSDVLNKHPILNTIYNRLIPTYFFDFDYIKRKYYCFQGTFLADIDSQGNLYSCTERFTKLGNLLQDPMLKLWNSERAFLVRKKDPQMTQCYWQANAIMSIYLTKLLRLGIDRGGGFK